VANPAAYAYAPRALAAAHNVRIIDNDRAGIAIALSDTLNTN
jgi:hypothetical protein